MFRRNNHDIHKLISGTRESAIRASKSRSGIFSLPRELRDCIYGQILCPNERGTHRIPVAFLCRELTVDPVLKWLDIEKNTVTLFQASSRLRAEVLATCFSEFAFEEHVNWCPDSVPPRQLLSWWKAIGQQNAALIKTCVIEIRRCPRGQGNCRRNACHFNPILEAMNPGDYFIDRRNSSHGRTTKDTWIKALGLNNTGLKAGSLEIRVRSHDHKAREAQERGSEADTFKLWGRFYDPKSFSSEVPRWNNVDEKFV